MNGKSWANSVGNVISASIVGGSVFFICPPSEWKLLIAVLAAQFVVGVERIVDAIRDVKTP